MAKFGFSQIENLLGGDDPEESATTLVRYSATRNQQTTFQF
jgi:hypothetical protein